MNKNKFNSNGLNETNRSFKSIQDEKISRLRQNFVDYLLQTKNSNK